MDVLRLNKHKGGRMQGSVTNSIVQESTIENGFVWDLESSGHFNAL